MCMDGALVTLTGVPTVDRVDIVKRIEWLGATFTKNLVKSTTHLIAQETSSKKYQASVGLGIPVLTLDWLSESYEKSKTLLFDAKETDFLKKYACPMFLGCVITASNIKERDKIKEIVEKGGGKYSGQMAYKECTHLVIDRPEGQKYKMAQKWGSISIVAPQWIYDCEKEGHRLSEELSKYTIRKASTPSKEEFRSPNPPDVSAIHSSTLSVSNIDETILSVRGPVQSMATMREHSTHLDNTVTQPELSTSCDALSKRKVCVRGFDDKTTASLVAMVTRCGGVRSLSTVNADYIVVSSLDEDTKQHIKSLRQPVVSSNWLRAVHSSQTLVDVEPYLFQQPIKRRRSSLGSDPPSSKSTKLSSEEPLLGDQSMLDTEMLDGIGDQQLFSQYSGANAKAERTLTDTKSTPTSDVSRKEVADWVDKIGVGGHPVPRSTKSPFCKIRLRLHDKLASKDWEEMSLLIRTHGGIITEDGEDYCVAPLIFEQMTGETTSSKLVSVVWVRACDRNCALLPVDSNPLFTPMSKVMSDILTGCVVSTTGLSAHERNAISHLMAAAGGHYFEDLRKLPGETIPATTHLICESTESAKYKAAQNWGINVTNIRWLTESLRAGTCQPISNYQPVKERVDVSEKRTLASLQTPVHSRVQTLRKGLIASQKKSSGRHHLSTSILDEPDKQFQPKLDMACFETPTSKQAEPQNKSEDTPLDQALDKYLQLALDKHYVKTPDLVKPSTGIVLTGVVVCLSKKLSSQSAHVCSLTTSLGGQFKSVYDSSVTHFIFQGKATEGEYRTAKRANQHIVCLLWLEKCKEEQMRVPEAQYPYNYKSNRALRGIENSTPSKSSGRLSSPLTESASPLDERNEEAGVGHDLETAVEARQETQTTMAETLSVYKQIKAYMNKRVTIPKHSKRSEEAPLLSGDSTEASKLKYGCMETQSQGDMLVTWDDTTSRCEREIANRSSDLDTQVFAQLDEEFTQEQEMKAPTSQDLSANYTVDNTEAMETSMSEKPLAPCKVFQFSGFSNEVRDEMAEKLNSLGAQTLVASNFDVTCTHVILNKPQRNEKYLCALVKGLWVLHQSYVQACVQAGCLISEDRHEWGNPEATHLSASPLTTASHLRRLSVQGGAGDSPFSGWRVILALAQDKTDSMRRILELGGAEMVSNRILADTDAVATHAFIDIKKGQVSEDELAVLVKQGVKCLRAEYIPARLMSTVSVNENKYSVGITPSRCASGDLTPRRRTRQQSIT
ncbi:DNA topoisomerase 2-binding protein 1-like [Watersipora subatra]|uniref:DNA topoisomerase 2-binding protein 1-like n=1 Tax=Watersipora subatra TaxID=2589382 RepID=UPI00355B1B1B